MDTDRSNPYVLSTLRTPGGLTWMLSQTGLLSGF
jgi:hypothetical protein